MPYRQTTVLLIVATPLCTAVITYTVPRRLAVTSRMACGLVLQLALIRVTALGPLPKTMEHVQVSAVPIALVVADPFLVPERSRWCGALSGPIAAIKLTSAAATLVLLARRER